MSNKLICPLEFTDNAYSIISDLILENTSPETSEIRLRVYISGGGCSGLIYGMGLDSELNEDEDTVYIYKDITVVIPNTDIKYLEGSIVDYITDIGVPGFKVSNPNAVKSCGCGQSFSVEEDSEGKTLTGKCSSCPSLE